MRKLLIKWLGGVDAADYSKVVNDHNIYCEHVAEGRRLDHLRDGTGVTNLIEEILFNVIEEELGNAERPHGGTSRADVIETDEAVSEFATLVAQDICAFADNVAKRNARDAKWGTAGVRTGVSRLFAAAASNRRSVLLRAFARIWAKEHKDARIDDVLSDEQQREWKSLPPRARRAINHAVANGYTYWA